MDEHIEVYLALTCQGGWLSSTCGDSETHVPSIIEFYHPLRIWVAEEKENGEGMPTLWILCPYSVTRI